MLSCNTLVQAVEHHAGVQVLVFLDVFEARLVHEIAHERKCFSLHALSREPTEFSGWHENVASLNYQCGEPVRLHPHRARADSVRLTPPAYDSESSMRSDERSMKFASQSHIQLRRSDSLCAQRRAS